LLLAENSAIRIHGVTGERVDMERQRQEVKAKAEAEAEEEQELTAPYLWAELLRERQLSQIASDPRTANAQFTRKEKGYVIRQLGDIKQRLIAQHQLPP
jgi:hypothetical protein